MALLPASAAARGARAGPAPAVVAAAADLKFALEEIVVLFERDTSHRLRLVFGSSGNLYAQIRQGAPFGLFLSADEALVFRLADAGLTRDRGTVYAIGRLAILVPRGSPLKPDGELRDLAEAVRDGRLRKFAIANPEHAPYGQRAQEALQNVGLWEAIRPRLVLGENVAQAAQFALSGSAQGGLVGSALARAPEIARSSAFGIVPATLHRPLVQRMVLTKAADAAATAFCEYLTTPRARDVLQRFGFETPER